MPSGTTGASRDTQPAFLMCPPRFFNVQYVINPWMEGNVHRASPGEAARQWNALHAAVCRVARVLLLAPEPGVPDMVFTANAGLLHRGRAVLSRFCHEERGREEPFYQAWFQAAGIAVDTLPPEIPFEGEGDALFTPDGKRLWAGHGWRTHLRSHALLAGLLGCEVVSLRLVDPRFYHLDTCFCPLANGDLLYFPAAFDAESRARIEAWYPKDRRIAVAEPDALAFACNAVHAGRTVILNEISPALADELQARGFEVVQVRLGEFLKAGGAAKCLCLRLHETGA